MAGPALHPSILPRRGPKVNALLFQGMRDTLFNFNEGYANYQCLRSEGGDVRLLSYQSGHNAAHLVPDPGEAYLPPGNAFDGRCGSLAFEDRDAGVLRPIPQGRARRSRRSADQALPVDCEGRCGAGQPGHDLAERRRDGGRRARDPRYAGTGLDQPVAVDLGITGAQGSSVVAGIPHLKLKVQAAPNSAGEPILFVGLGQKHNAAPDAWDLIDNQVLPLRGTGTFDVDLVGVAARLAAGEKLALLVYGRQSLFAAPSQRQCP